jgi:hypothetical protein
MIIRLSRTRGRDQRGFDISKFRTSGVPRTRGPSISVFENLKSRRRKRSGHWHIGFSGVDISGVQRTGGRALILVNPEIGLRSWGVVTWTKA